MNGAVKLLKLSVSLFEKKKMEEKDEGIAKVLGAEK